jgi:hypothetical protein
MSPMGQNRPSGYLYDTSALPPLAASGPPRVVTAGLGSANKRSLCFANLLVSGLWGAADSLECQNQWFNR